VGETGKLGGLSFFFPFFFLFFSFLFLEGVISLGDVLRFVMR
jgi:hypothetical protein